MFRKENLSIYKYQKRLLDFIFSLLLILLLSPFFIITPILIWLSMGWPVIFSQKRICMNNREFRIYKFRSMRHKSEYYKTDVDRITFLGKILRISRIDEFPQLFNILKGDMSFIGPRPLLPKYLPYYLGNEIHRHNIRPGLSGLSQVSGSYPDWEEQFAFDLQYIEKMSFILDCKILIRTVLKVIRPTKKLITGKAGREPFDIYRQSKSN